MFPFCIDHTVIVAAQANIADHRSRTGQRSACRRLRVVRNKTWIIWFCTCAAARARKFGKTTLLDSQAKFSGVNFSHRLQFPSAPPRVRRRSMPRCHRRADALSCTLFSSTDGRHAPRWLRWVNCNRRSRRRRAAPRRAPPAAPRCPPRLRRVSAAGQACAPSPSARRARPASSPSPSTLSIRPR